MKKLNFLLLLFTFYGFSQSPGDIIITEIMQNPNAVSDSNGEWFEVYNTTGAAIDMNGWVIKDAGSDSHTIMSTLQVSAGGFAILGRNGDSSMNGGITIDYVFSGFTLTNTDDEIIIETSGGTTIDQVNYDGGPSFPDPTGASMELNSGLFNNSANNIGSNWDVGTVAFGDGDLGTPGSANSLPTKENQIDGFELYPNPTERSYVTISSKSGARIEVKIFDLLGKHVISEMVSDNSLDVSDLNAGIYLLRATQDEAVTTKKLVIK